MSTTICDTFSQFLPSSWLDTSSSAKTIHVASSPKGEDTSYFGVGSYGSPEHSDDDDLEYDSGRSDSTLEDESLMLFGHPLERMPRLTSVDHGFHYEQDLNLLLLDSRGSSQSNSVISTASGASYDSM